MTLEPHWLVETFKDAGLTPEQAVRAGEVALRRLIRRQRVTSEPRPELHFRSSITADPLVSVNRILGLGDGGLPFYDEWSGRLSETDVTHALTESGLELPVALGFAKVVVEAQTPQGWFEPVWNALGRNGPVNLEDLSRLDWSGLRTDADRMMPPLDPGPPPPPSRRGPRPIVSAPDATKAPEDPTVRPKPKAKAKPKKPAAPRAAKPKKSARKAAAKPKKSAPKPARKPIKATKPSKATKSSSKKSAAKPARKPAK